MDEIIDEHYPPGTPDRRAFDYGVRRQRRIDAITGRLYSLLLRVPPSWPTYRDEWGSWNWRGVGPVVAQFWHDILSGLLEAFEDRRDPDHAWSVKSIIYNALDGLSWRFLDDEYIPTWTDVRNGRAGYLRFNWNFRRTVAIKKAQDTLLEIDSATKQER